VEAQILAAVEEIGPLTAADAAQVLGQPQPRTERSLAVMVAKGLLERQEASSLVWYQLPTKVDPDAALIRDVVAMLGDQIDAYLTLGELRAGITAYRALEPKRLLIHCQRNIRRLLGETGVLLQYNWPLVRVCRPAVAFAYENRDGRDSADFCIRHGEVRAA
jgi:sugar-specific transcriptional regulator TrmB